MKLFLCLILSLCTNLTYASERPSLSVLTSVHEFPGYREDYVDGTPTSGLEYELVEEICKVLQKKCQWSAIEPGFKVGPVPTILEKLEEDTYDIAIAFMRGTKERMYAAKASAPYLQTRVSIYGFNGSLENASRNKFGAPVVEGKAIKYAVVGAYEKSIREIFYSDESKYEILKVSTDAEALRAVLSGEADATLTSELKVKFSKELELYAHYESPKNEQWGPRIYASNKNVKLIRDINKALKVIIENGIYDQILRRHGGQGREPCFQGEDDDATVNIVENYPVCNQKLEKNN